MRMITTKLATGLLAVGLAAALPGQAFAAAAKVVLDAGHGGSDPGAVGVNGLYEKDVNLDVVFRLRDELTGRGYEVLLTRERDTALTLAERVEISNKSNPDLFVSVHANSYKDSRTRGSLVLYYDKDYPQSDYPPSETMAKLTPESKRLARLIQDAMVRQAGTADKGLVPSAAYVTRMGSVPSVLVETAFLSNRQDAELLADGGFRQRLAAGIADGISAYLPASKPDPVPGAFADVSAGHWANADIAKLKKMGIVEGEYGRFYPERALSRAEFVTMLERQFPLPARTADGSGAGGASGSGTTVTAATYGGGASSVPAGKPSDLTSAHWAYGPLMKAWNAGVLEGYKDGSIRPDKSLTRGEAAALIDRVIWPDAGQTAASTVFKDVPKTLWSAASINRLKEKGIIQGMADGTFAPDRPITRAEMAVLLSRLIH